MIVGKKTLSIYLRNWGFLKKRFVLFLGRKQYFVTFSHEKVRKFYVIVQNKNVFDNILDNIAFSRKNANKIIYPYIQETEGS